MVRKLALNFKCMLVEVGRQVGRQLCLLLLSASVSLPATWAESDSIASAWEELSITEQRWLAPIQEDWEAMSTDRRQRLRAMAQRWENLPPEAQQEVRAKISRWSKLDAQERQQAREKFSQFRRLSDKQRRKLALSRKRFMSLPLHKRQAIRRQWEQMDPDRRRAFQHSLHPPPKHR